MIFTLKHRDTPILRFEADPKAVPLRAHILDIVEDNGRLFPLGYALSDDGLCRWLRHRGIPRGRAYVERLLAKAGLSENRPFGVLVACRALSLSDCFWVSAEGDSGTWASLNLFDNPFDELVANIAFLGVGPSSGLRPSSSPEYTTDGSLPKCWRRENGDIWLYKAGSSGASNAGREPFCEFFAWQVACAMGMNAVEYRLARWKDRLCSVCRLFTSKELSFVPATHLGNDWDHVCNAFASFGPAFQDMLDDMMVFDAVILNKDRHLGNFGILVDADTNIPLKPAPLFDHGYSLLTFAVDDDFADYSTLRGYADTMQPKAPGGFVENAKRHLADRHKAMLRGLGNFQFRQDGNFDFPQSHLDMLSSLVREQAQAILGN